MRMSCVVGSLGPLSKMALGWLLFASLFFKAFKTERKINKNLFFRIKSSRSHE